jgi:hypothetical protein
MPIESVFFNAKIAYRQALGWLEVKTEKRKTRLFSLAIIYAHCTGKKPRTKNLRNSTF